MTEKVSAQKKYLPNYQITSSGDTINRIDKNNLKQGAWQEIVTSDWDEQEGYEIGRYYNSKKIGTWKRYSSEGILQHEINYNNGYKDGKAKYYQEGYLFCIGNYKALRTDVAWDTILVETPDSDIPLKRVIQTSLGSVKHGFWTFYQIPGFEIEKIVEYQYDELVFEKKYLTHSDSVYLEQKQAKYPHNSNALPASFWIQESDKKKVPVRYTDKPEILIPEKKR